ncbi:MAG: beta-ketoacyl synthase N-terminal-like domain-containing protein, partial [Syntrophothermus sp.]
PRNRVKLWRMAEVVGSHFGMVNPPLVISNACISGVLALNTAFRYIREGYYKNIIVAGGDMITEFVVSGFLSFQALSPAACKPFDANRTGLTIGEGCGTMILSDSPSGRDVEITISGAAVTNDANHISGPSRTGEELALAMQRAMKEAGVNPAELDYVSAHGTATIYNDEMESRALAFAGLSQTPVNSYKGYWGHTLGAAGVIESVLTHACMRENLLIASTGFSEPGTPEVLNVITENCFSPINNSLKIASGFGGCNGAVIFRKQ